MKLPENIKYYDSDSGEVLAQSTSDFVKNIVKQYKVKDIEGNKASDVVKNILTLNFRAKDEDVELPEGYEHLSDVNTHCSEIAAEHRKISDEEDNEAKKEKELKQQEKILAKEAKEKEEKEYKQNAEKFEETFTKKAKALIEKAEAGVKSFMQSIKLPNSITLSGNGMGMLFSESATKDDIATAAAQMVAASEGNKAMGGALQFNIGDAVNALHKNKIYRTKGEACKQIQFLITDKLGRKFSGGGINANALMAERVPADKRIMGKPHSLYYFAAKVIAPKLKEAKESDQIEMNKKFEEERNNVIELVNNGTISSNAELEAHVAAFKKSVGIVVESPNNTKKAIDRFLKRLFFATWIKENLVKDGIAKVRELNVDENAPAVEYTVAQLTDIEQEAMNNLQNLLIPDVDKLITGEHEIEVENEKVTTNDKGKEVKTKTKIKKIVPFLMDDPFEAKENEQASAKAAEPVKEEESEDDAGE